MDASRRHRAALLIAFAAVTLVFALVLPSVSQGHFSRHTVSHYSLKRSTCARNYDNLTDPISVVFHNRGSIGRVRNHIRYHAGWLITGDPGHRNVYVKTHGDCRSYTEEQASNIAAAHRYHIRLWEMPHGDGFWGQDITVGTPHYERVTRECRDTLAHRVEDPPDGPSGYDRAKLELIAQMKENEDHHEPIKWRYWGNTRKVKQCGGRRTGHNGYVAFIPVPEGEHIIGG
jgi:hypothetical protein